MFHKKVNSFFIYSAFLLLFFQFFTSISAQSIFDNPITGTNPNLSNPYTTGQNVNANITVSGIGRGPGINGRNANDRYDADSWSSSISIDLNDYFYFTLTPVAGHKINFISFVYTGGATVQGPNMFAFRSSVDGYTTNIGAPNTAGTVISLSAPSFQNIKSSITFRFYGWNSSNSGGKYSINSFTFNGAAALPIELISFRGHIEGTATKLNWVTATEYNNAYFSIERSSNGRDFTGIAELEGGGTSFVPKEYLFSDDNPLQGKNYYRLRQVDFDGKFSYSSIVTVSFGKAKEMLLIHHPTTDNLHILLEKPAQEDASWHVFDMSGRLMFSGKMPTESTEYLLNIPELSAGAYVLRLSDGQEVMVEQFIKY
ncbi:MAG: T9SS type A sorting domain-containing protein [Phycisphaerae bacterium]|nr:T9SS type A sorting domain-containing protein [Saprospiraceae bacterium]